MGSFPSMHSLAKASPATSLIAETFTTTEQVCNVCIPNLFYLVLFFLSLKVLSAPDIYLKV